MWCTLAEKGSLLLFDLRERRGDNDTMSASVCSIAASEQICARAVSVEHAVAVCFPNNVDTPDPNM